MKFIKQTIFTLSILLLASFAVAQCPESFPGFHRVNKGETLYQISKEYNVSINDLCKWNSIDANVPLSICQELAISTPKEIDLNVTTDFTAVDVMKKQDGASHVIQEGETIAGIAELYGYTEEKFRRFNGLNAEEPAWPGLVLKSSDCICESTTVTGEAATSKIIAGNNDPAKNSKSEILPWDEYISQNEAEGDSGSGLLFDEDPFYQSSPTANIYKKQNSRSPQTYSANNTDAQPKLSTNEPAADSGTSKFKTPEEELLNNTQITANNKAVSPKPADLEPSNSISPEKHTPTKEELDMVNEINKVRTDPAIYVKYIEMYKRDIANGKSSGSVETCDELIAELRNTPRLAPLQTSECLTQAAKAHGDDIRSMGSFVHVGSDGSYPWDRVRKACTSFIDGNENLVGGANSIRRSIILLLVDDGIPDRGHRRNILSKEWKYVACYNAGKIGNMPNNWVQNFAK